MPVALQESFRPRLAGSPFESYAYAYPHKTAYRALQPPPTLRELWRDEDRSRLYFYLHVPFCEMRCGFCNLFTTSNPDGDLVARWSEALQRQATAVAEALGPEAHFARGALGGGTPSFLRAEELASLLGSLRATFGRGLDTTPLSVEFSPATTDADKLAVLRAHGLHRASLGVQSFLEAETRAAGRAQSRATVEAAIAHLREARVPVLNLDLIYGIPGQTPMTWRESLRAALQFRPEELYLYPLYVRPLTGLDRAHRAPGDNRSGLYREACELLLAHGYRQVSMRLFRAPHWAGLSEPVYVCQEDGMVGLGVGARSYTRTVHYSDEYAVRRDGIGEIIARYAATSAAEFRVARHGVRLDADEQRRRYVIKSILRADGLNRADYRARFGSDVLEDFPGFAELGELELITSDGDTLRPTALGLEWSDSIGPWLYSAPMRVMMEEYAWA